MKKFLRHVCYWGLWLLRGKPARPAENVLGAWNVTVRVREGDNGPVLREIRQHNLVVATGIGKLRDLAGYPGSLSIAYAPSNATPGYLAVGTGTTAVDPADDALETEVFRAALTRRVPDTGKITYYYDLPTASANGNALTEAGIFTAGSGGTPWARVTHSVINKTASISVQYQWDWTFAAT